MYTYMLESKASRKLKGTCEGCKITDKNKYEVKRKELSRKDNMKQERKC